MNTRIMKTAALGLALTAGSGLALAAPAAAAPASHSAAYSNSAVWGDQAQDHGRKNHRHAERRYDNRYYGSGYNNNRYNNGYNNGYPQQAYYGEPVYNNTSVWQGNDGQYYCRKSNGTTGLLIGGAAGALLGREIAGRGGDRTLGAVLGAAGGALLGRAIDRGGSRCR